MFALRINPIPKISSSYRQYFIKQRNSTIFNRTNVNFNLNKWFYQICFAHTDAKFHLKFSDLIAKRQNEASRSIVVQVHSAKSCSDLYTYCNQYGAIKTMNHYTVGSDPLHYIIVEFENEDAVSNILTSSCHVSSHDAMTIPVRSQFLWFRAVGKQKRKKTIDNVELPIPFSENGTSLYNKEDIDSLLFNANNISDQMIALYKLTCLGETGTRIRFLTCRQIEMALKGMFPESEALPFGSSVNSYGKEGCDLDMYLNLDSKQQDNSNSRLAFHSKAGLLNERSQVQRHMECVADILQLFLPGCMNVRRILQARVPIIKYNQEQTGLECDLSMTNMIGVHMSDLLYTLGCIDERVKPLVFTIRRWAQETSLTTNYPGRWITNFSLTLMILYFLQKVHVIPTINTLMKLAEPCDKIVTEDGMNCSFLHDLSKLPKPKSQNSDTLYTLLLQFFEHYSQFDFQNRAISLNEGREIHKPESCALYIVNPLERHFNVSKNVSAEELERLRIEFRNAAWILESQNSTKPLTSESDEAWGLLALFKTKKLETNKLLNMVPIQNRLVEIKGLFENNENDDVKATKKETFRNNNVIREIRKIKSDTAANIRKLNPSSKIRIRRR